MSPVESSAARTCGQQCHSARAKKSGEAKAKDELGPGPGTLARSGENEEEEERVEGFVIMYLCDDRLTPGQLPRPSPPRLAVTLVNLTAPYGRGSPCPALPCHALPCARESPAGHPENVRHSSVTHHALRTPVTRRDRDEPVPRILVYNTVSFRFRRVSVQRAHYFSPVLIAPRLTD